jgi:hypothetical protein
MYSSAGVQHLRSAPLQIIVPTGDQLLCYELASVAIFTDNREDIPLPAWVRQLKTPDMTGRADCAALLIEIRDHSVNTLVVWASFLSGMVSSGL